MQENIVESKDHYEKGFLVLSFSGAGKSLGEGRVREREEHKVRKHKYIKSLFKESVRPDL